MKSLLPSAGERLADSLRTSMLALADGLRRPGVTVRVHATGALRAVADVFVRWIPGHVLITVSEGRQ